ncbi:hypothetical protein J3U68_06275 [Snodgrassella sp. B3882]|uniref:hypothetical protein n=1 Tax=Snodgrassella sp. B3882 TaxID=2818037 RepID=UPI00226A4F02|nr:hypothetical protein [Snodgrassella sp. B3882]MCX8745018.1 hypothetical protein [Snodgrassella sp. B3882]
MKLNLEWRWSVRSSLFLLIIIVVPFVQALHIDTKWEKIVEQAQTIFLFGSFVFTLVLTLKYPFNAKQRAFWLWAALWWLVLLGRDQNWGRQMWPGYSIAVYHSIAAVLILGLVLMLSWPQLRQGIGYYSRRPFPVWDFILATVAFLLADAVERGRWIAQFILYYPQYDDLLEELYECPFMLALFSVSCYMQWQTIKELKQKRA